MGEVGIYQAHAYLSIGGLVELSWKIIAAARIIQVPQSEVRLSEVRPSKVR
jgi:hypothetical protein